MKRGTKRERKESNKDSSVLKRSRNVSLNKIDDRIWVSATDLRNYYIGDLLIDYLKISSSSVQTSMNERDKGSFSTFIMNQGNKFEKSIISFLRSIIPEIVYVSDKIDDDSVKKTIELMELGTPFIYSAPVRNYTNKTHGIIDLLVRNDHLDKIIKGTKTDNSKCKFGNFHYVAIDIKFSTLPLRCDGIHILNTPSFRAYKGQLRLYTEAIGIIQEYIPKHAFILGRRFTFKTLGDTFSGISCLDRLGVIDFSNVDSSYVESLKQAINWVRDVKENYKSWSLNPPSRPELYPNMCIDSGKWNKEKSLLAESLSDITQIWNCGVVQRMNALSKGVSSWKDKKCTSSVLGFKDGKKSIIIDSILEINRQEEILFKPSFIKTNLHSWRTPCNEAFIDFETFSDVFFEDEEMPIQNRNGRIFMIGLFYNNSYINFTSLGNSEKDEISLMMSFCKFMKENGNPKLWYWFADKTIWDRALKRVNFKPSDPSLSFSISDPSLLFRWHDMFEIFKTEPISIKGCFGFSLKEIAQSMKKHNMIECNLDSKCKNGLEAGILAWNVYEKVSDKKGHDSIYSVLNEEDSKVLKDIETYNKFDVNVLKEILFYLRKER